MFKNIIGQKKIIGKDGIFNKMIVNEDYYSVILYGTPGSGKTTLAQEFVKNIKLDSYLLNAVNISKMELTNFLQLAQGNPIILVIDEIHRLDRTKQDLLLPYLEKKEFYIIGTTTQNPYYSLSQALCSRFFIFEMEKLNNEEIYKYLKELDEENSFSEEQLNELMNLSKGDIRKLKMYFQFIIKNFNPSEIKKMKIDLYFSSNDFNVKSNHNKYDLLSALQKSIRASDVNAAIFYLSALLLNGEYEDLLRRIKIIAAEDIGLANTKLVNQAHDVCENFNSIGMPEGKIILTNYIIELSLSKKSTSAYNAIKKAIDDVQKNQYNIPKHIQNNQYEYNRKKTFFTNNLPNNLIDKKYLEFLGDSDNEKKLFKRYEYLNKLKKGDLGYEK